MKTVTLLLGEMVDLECGIKILPEHRCYKWATLKEAVDLVRGRVGYGDLKKCFEKCQKRVQSL